LSFSYWIDNLGFITEGKLAAILIKPSLGVSNWPVIYYTFPCQLGSRSFLSLLPRIEEEAPTPSSPRHQQVFWRHCWGKRKLLQGEFRTHILYFVLSFALLYFYLHRFIKNTKKLVSFVVVFTCLLLVC
jgi:hypothetical protein